jgi:hypothetical protein
LDKAKKMNKEIENDVFVKLDKIEQNKEEKPKTSSNNVAQSFEQIILNQARAMQPAREKQEEEKPESGSWNLGKESQVPENLPPENLPTESLNKKPEEEKPKAIHNYVQGSDPYRESPL